MMRRSCTLGGLLWMLVILIACQPSGSKTLPERVQSEAMVKVSNEAGVGPEGPDWQQAEDCWGKLALLRQGLSDGRIVDLDDTPFDLIEQGLEPVNHRWSQPVLSSASGGRALEVRCVIRVGQAIDRQSDHRLLDEERIRSRYQSGTRREKNPAYEVAKTRLRRVEKAAKPGKSSIIKVGDPLVDLVGTLVGGALTGLGQWGAGDQLEEALDTLMATPPSIEHPIYKSYHFEQARIRASREATLPVTLTDRRLQQSWQTSLKRREVRELSVVTGLDRQDEDYARHRQKSFTKDGLRQWLAEAPSLPLADIAASLLDRPSTVPLDRLALVKPKKVAAGDEALTGDFSFDAAALPKRRLLDVEREDTGRSLRGDFAGSSRIKVIGETTEAEGVFVASHLILTSSEVIGERGLIDIEDTPGHVILGLVAAVDHSLGLALIQSPSGGHPVAVSSPARGGKSISEVGSKPSTRFRRSFESELTHRTISTPWLVDGQLKGFRMPSGPDIDGEAIQAFLGRQQHLFPAD